MRDFFEWKIHHSPDDYIKTKDRRFLWDMNDNYQAVLTVDDWEFRVYTYFWNSSDNEPEEDGWHWCGDTFEHFTGYYDEDTLGYIKLDTGGSIEEIADDLYESCECQLNSLYRISRDSLKDFIKNHIEMVKKETRIYTYYK